MATTDEKDETGLASSPSAAEWLATRSSLAMIALRDHIERDPKKLGGVPLLRGTRFSVAQLFAELADSDSIQAIADDFELDAEAVRSVLHALAVYLNRPML